MSKAFPLVKDSFRFFKTHFLVIALILLPVVLPLELFNYWVKTGAPVDNSSAEMVAFFYALLTYPIYQSALILFMASLYTDQRPSITSLFKMSLKYWPHLFVLYALYSAGTTIGFLLLIIPGIFLTARWAFAEFNLLLVGTNIKQSFKNSFNSTKEFQNLLISGWLMIIGIFVVPYFLIGWLTVALQLDPPILGFLLEIIMSIMSPIFTIYAFRIYTLNNAPTESRVKITPET